jgi:6-phosphogluconolactonase
MTSNATRRSFLAGAAAVAGAPLLGVTGAHASPRTSGSPSRPGPETPVTAYVGSWTTAARDAIGPGVSVYRIERDSCRWGLVQTLAADDGTDTDGDAELLPANPAWLTLDHTQRYLYCAHADITKVTAFAVNQRTGQLTRLNTIDTGRVNPVYIGVDPTNRFIAVANYEDPGSVVTLPIRPDGSLGPIAGDVSFSGTPGPHKTEQLGSYAHCATFDPTGRWLVVPDKGLDRIWVLAFDPATGALTLNDPRSVKSREMAGPRHLGFHPQRPYAYCVDELRSTITSYHWDAATGVLEPMQVQPSQPPTMTGDCRVAEIAVAPSGRYVYASNRGGAGVIDPQAPQDTIGVWAVDPATGFLDPVTWVSTRGFQPRNFALDRTGKHLWAANEVSNTIVAFTVDQHTGVPRATGQVIKSGSPTCIAVRNS